jgi:membrane protease YdiL (CAAX protease family)
MSSLEVGADFSTPRAALWRRLRHAVSEQGAFLRQGRQGRWRWPWALLSTLLAVLGIGILQACVMGIGWAFRVESAPDKVLDPQQLSSFVMVLLAFLPLIIVPCLLTRYLHKVSWRQLLASSGRFDWRLYRRAAGAFFVVGAALAAFDYSIDPKAYQLVHRGIDYLPWLGLGLAVIFVQTLAEEILFRGYLLRMWGAVVPYAWLTASVIIAVFISLHVNNPDFKLDVWFNLIAFALAQLVWSYLWLRTGSVAATAGLHWANNVTSFFFLAAVPGWSPSMAVAIYRDDVLLKGSSHLLDPYAWAITLLGIGLTLGLLVWRRSPFYLPVARSDRHASAHLDEQAGATSVPTVKGAACCADDLR